MYFEGNVYNFAVLVHKEFFVIDDKVNMHNFISFESQVWETSVEFSEEGRKLFILGKGRCDRKLYISHNIAVWSPRLAAMLASFQY
jgi:hypothetical protein